MDLRLTDEQEQLVDAFAALYAKHSTPERVRAAEPVGFDPALWTRLVELGTVAMAVGEAARRVGRRRCSTSARWPSSTVVAWRRLPPIEAQVAARLLARLGVAGAGGAGRRPGRRPAGHARPAPGQRDGRGSIWCRPARSPTTSSCSSATTSCSCRSGDERAHVGEPRRRCRWPTSPSPTARRCSRRDRSPLAAYDIAVDEWLALTAGGARRHRRARPRDRRRVRARSARPSGVPIGSFQAISHRLADSAAAVDGARLLAYEGGVGGRRGAGAAPPSWRPWRSPSPPRPPATPRYRSLHFHGGYGFMMEYDIQLYYRRARAWANVYATREPATGGSPTAATGDGGGGLMDFRLGDEREALRERGAGVPRRAR